MSLAVARMQKEVSAVLAENHHALKIQGMENRRKIQMLLVMAEPVANRVAEPGSIRLYNLAVATAQTEKHRIAIDRHRAWFVIPAFFDPLLALDRPGRDCTLVFHTFSRDLPEVASELMNAFCEGRHP
jgi:hypothetical protein